MPEQKRKELLEELAKVMELHSHIQPVGDISARKLAFQPVESQIRYLRTLVTVSPKSDMIERLNDLEHHLFGALFIRQFAGHRPEKHLEWARQSLRVCERIAKRSDDF